MAMRIPGLPSLEDMLAQVDGALAADPNRAMPTSISPEVAAFARRRLGVLGAPVPETPTVVAPGVPAPRQEPDAERPPDFAQERAADGDAAGAPAAPGRTPKWKRFLGGFFGTDLDARAKREHAQHEQDRADYEKDRADHEKELQKRNDDPNSRESKAAQSSWAPYLRAGGWTDEEIGRTSATQLRGINISGIVGARQERQQKEAEATRKAEAEQKELEEKRKYEAELWDKHNATTSEQAMERTRLLAGLGAQRMTQAERDRIEAEGRSEGRRIAAEERKAVADAARSEREAEATERRKIANELREADKADAAQLVRLRAVRKQLEARKDEWLPGQKGVIDEVATKGKKALIGGSGTSDADARLNTQLSAMGMEDYRKRNGAAANDAGERATAEATFRGNGSTASAIAAIDQRIAETEATAAARRAAAGGAAEPKGGRPAPKTQAPPKPGMKLVRVGQRRVWLTPEGLQQMIDDGIGAEVEE